mgnify:CR=1 FL=1
MRNGQFDLSGRVAIVTGGNGGIGLGMARGFAQAGANVIVAGRNAEKSKAAAAEVEALKAQVASTGAAAPPPPPASPPRGSRQSSPM